MSKWLVTGVSFYAYDGEVSTMGFNDEQEARLVFKLWKARERLTGDGALEIGSVHLWEMKE